jgi:TatD DNase family protein
VSCNTEPVIIPVDYMRLYDAHNHLQDNRLTPWRDPAVTQCRDLGLVRMVVNGTCETDWPEVLVLARRYPEVLPSFGYHPWYVRQRSDDWKHRLVHFLDTVPSAVGEVGLDRWILGRRHESWPAALDPPPTLAEQQEVFIWQLHLAAERNCPVSIHCLQAWGLLHDILREGPRPACGFLLHSYGGPVEMIKPMADLGAYFSLPGAFAQERKHRQREAFKHVPPERLLLETDAPDQVPPEKANRFPITNKSDGRPLNHPANIAAIYKFAADLLDASHASLAERVDTNFRRLFASGR